MFSVCVTHLRTLVLVLVACYESSVAEFNKMYAKRTRIFSVTRIRSSNSARINKSDFTTENIV